MTRINYAYGRYRQARFWGKIDTAWHQALPGSSYWPRSWVYGLLSRLNRWAYERFHRIEHQQGQCACEWHPEWDRSQRSA